MLRPVPARIPADQLAQLESALDLTTPQLAKLLGVSVRTLYRGVERDGAAAAIIQALQRHLAVDAQSALIVRSLVLSAAQNDGLPVLLDRLLSTFVAVTRLQIRT